MGFIGIGAYESQGDIIKTSGMKMKDLEKLKAKKGTVVGFPGSTKVTTEKLLTTKCDILIPAALENQIDANIARKIQCKIIGESANGPTLPEADPILYKKNIIIVPDILANAGGVTISYYEWVQNNTGQYWGFVHVAKLMEDHLVTGFKDAYELSQRKNIDMRRACMAIAVKRVMEAFELRGIWP